MLHNDGGAAYRNCSTWQDRLADHTAVNHSRVPKEFTGKVRVRQRGTEERRRAMAGTMVADCFWRWTKPGFKSLHLTRRTPLAILEEEVRFQQWRHWVRGGCPLQALGRVLRGEDPAFNPVDRGVGLPQDAHAPGPEVAVVVRTQHMASSKDPKGFSKEVR